MSVYVGKCFSTPNGGRNWPYKKAAHLMADTIGELMIFADKIHLEPAWLQLRSTPHYDLTEGKRREAVKAGAIPFHDIRSEGVWLIERKKKLELSIESPCITCELKGKCDNNCGDIMVWVAKQKKGK